MNQFGESMDILATSLKASHIVLRIRKLLPNDIQKQLDHYDVKIGTYVKKAITRWLFNAIKNGKNPFVGQCTAADFIPMEDLKYLFSKHEDLVQYVDHQFDWTWINALFEQESECDQPGHLHVLRGVDVVAFTYRNKPYSLLNSHSLRSAQYDRVQKLYSGDPKMMNTYITILLSRYDACGINNKHYAVPPKVIEYSGARTELFGSPFNTCCAEYCSPFPDIEKYFGSLGSFFDIGLLSSGIYFMNPPYDEQFIYDAVIKVLQSLETKAEIIVIANLPMWDAESQESHKGRRFTDKPFRALQELEKSRFIKSRAMLRYENHLFYDYYSGKLIPTADTHLIVLGNTTYKTTAQEIANVWAAQNEPR